MLKIKRSQAKMPIKDPIKQLEDDRVLLQLSVAQAVEQSNRDKLELQLTIAQLTECLLTK